MLKELMKLVTSFSAPRSISSLMESLRMVNGSLVIVHPSLMRASLTVSWKMSLADIGYCNFWVNNAINKGKVGKEKRAKE
jgi:hypothetical protein